MGKHIKRIKGIILHFFAAVLLVAVFSFGSFAAETDDAIVGISAVPVEIEEYTCGYCVESQEGKWFYYSDINPESFVVSYDSGEEKECDYYELLELLNTSETDLLSEQSYDNQWKTGDYTVTLEIGDFTVDYIVKITESTVDRIVAEDLEIVEGTNGSYISVYDEDGNETGEYWFQYDINSADYTVEYKDGSSESFSDLEALSEKLKCKDYEYISGNDQSFDNRWGVGSHKVSLELGAYIIEHNVKIVSSGISSIEVSDFSVTEYTNGYYDFDYSDFYRYYTYPDELFVTYTDGSRYAVDFDDFVYENSFFCEVYGNQTYENPWGVGKHGVTLYMGGSFVVGYEIEILPSDIESISVSDVTIVEGTNGYWEWEYSFDEETGEETENKWFCYYEQPEAITVNYKDGTSETYNYDDITFDNGLEPLLFSDQSYEKQWGTGIHTVTLKIANAACTYNVEITEYPYSDIIFDKVTYAEGQNGYYSLGENEDGSAGYYFNYYIVPEKFTVVKNDGNRLTYDYTDDLFEEITLFYPLWEDDQSDAAPWGIGTHKASVNVCGRNVEIEIEIVSNGITSVDIKNAVANEGVHGEYKLINTEDGGKNHIFIYEPYFDNITLNVNGDVIETTPSDFTQATGLEQYIVLDPEQSTQLPYGKHTAKLLIGNTEYSFEFEASEGNVESVDIDKITLLEEFDAEKDWYWPDDSDEEYEWYRYNYYPSIITVNYKEGDSVEYIYDDLIKGDFCYIIYDDQSFTNQWKKGINKATIAIGGTQSEIEVEIVSADEESIKPLTICVGETKTVEFFPHKRTFFKFVPELTGEYSLFSTGDYDTKAWLYDSDFNLISEADDKDFSDYNFELKYELIHGKTYYYAVKGLDNTESGRFDVTMSGYMCEHEFINYIYNNDATCTEDGTKTAVCENCTKTNTVTAEATRLGHDAEWVTVKKASCTEDGERTRSCSRCDFTEAEKIPSEGHNGSEAVRENETVPTCTTSGSYQAVVYCAQCNTELSRTEVTVDPVPHSFVSSTCTEPKICSVCKITSGTADGHTLETMSEVAATCTEKGYTEGKKCAVCEKIIIPQKEIAPTGHYEVIVSGKAATCTEKGLTNGKACPVCDTVIEERKEIPALGHSFVEKNGKKVCSLCNTVIDLPTVPSTQPSEGQTTQPDTDQSTEPSTKPSVEETTRPSVEDTTVPPEEEPTTQHTHTEIIIPAVSATYTADGLTEGKKCSSCGEILVAQKTVSRKKLKKVKNLKVKKTTSASVKLSWTKVTGADSYKVYYSTDGKKWMSVKVKKNTATIKKLKSGMQYRFKVRAFAGKYYGSASKVLKKTTKVKKPTLSKVTSVKKNQVTVSWKKVTRASGYVVEYSTSKKFTKKTTKAVKIKKGKTTKTTLKNLKSGKKYYIRIKAYKTVNKNAVYGSVSSVKTVVVK